MFYFITNSLFRAHEQALIQFSCKYKLVRDRGVHNSHVK